MEKIKMTFFLMILVGLMMLALWVLTASAANYERMMQALLG